MKFAYKLIFKVFLNFIAGVTGYTIYDNKLCKRKNYFFRRLLQIFCFGEIVAFETVIKISIINHYL